MDNNKITPMSRVIIILAIVLASTVLATTCFYINEYKVVRKKKTDNKVNVIVLKEKIIKDEEVINKVVDNIYKISNIAYSNKTYDKENKISLNNFRHNIFTTYMTNQKVPNDIKLIIAINSVSKKSFDEVELEYKKLWNSELEMHRNVSDGILKYIYDEQTKTYTQTTPVIETNSNVILSNIYKVTSYGDNINVYVKYAKIVDNTLFTDLTDDITKSKQIDNPNEYTIGNNENENYVTYKWEFTKNSNGSYSFASVLKK